MAREPKLTLSVIRADVGGYVGNTNVHPELIETAKQRLFTAKEKALIVDYHVLRCGDDIELIITHHRGCGDADIHELAWNALAAATRVAKDMKLFAAGRDLEDPPFSGHSPGHYSEHFSGKYNGTGDTTGPWAAELEFIERESEPILIFMADKTSAGAWNLPLYKAFGDPFNTPGLVMDPAMMKGFTIGVVDVEEGSTIRLALPGEVHELLALIGASSRFMVYSIWRSTDNEQAAAVTTPAAGRALKDGGGGGGAAGDDPVAVVRCESGFPTVGEVMEPFAFPHLVGGWTRGAHAGPLMPVPFYDANPSRSDGPPRVICAGFQTAGGRLIGPHDMFDDPAYDGSRRLADTITDYMRRHGPFEPHRLSEGRTRHTTLPEVIEGLKKRFVTAKRRLVKV